LDENGNLKSSDSNENENENEIDFPSPSDKIIFSGFGVPLGEVFGFLAVNSAGKTTSLGNFFSFYSLASPPPPK